MGRQYTGAAPILSRFSKVWERVHNRAPPGRTNKTDPRIVWQCQVQWYSVGIKLQNICTRWWGWELLRLDPFRGSRANAPNFRRKHTALHASLALFASWAALFVNWALLARWNQANRWRHPLILGLGWARNALREAEGGGGTRQSSAEDRHINCHDQVWLVACQSSRDAAGGCAASHEWLGKFDHHAR